MKLICFCQKHKEICQVRENKDMKIPKKKTKTKKYVLFTFMGYTCTLVVFCFKLTFFFLYLYFNNLLSDIIQTKIINLFYHHKSILHDKLV